MLFLFRSTSEVEKRINSKHFRKFWDEPGYKRADQTYCSASHQSENERQTMYTMQYTC